MTGVDGANRHGSGINHSGLYRRAHSVRGIAIQGSNIARIGGRVPRPTIGMTLLHIAKFLSRDLGRTLLPQMVMDCRGRLHITRKKLEVKQLYLF